MTRTSLVVRVAALCAASSLPCQVWAENGDAGDVPITAQQVQGAGNLTQITGTLGANDVDVYLIQIYDPVTFQASTVGGAAFDTQLFLFDQEGNAVSRSDNLAGGVQQSRVTGQFVVAPGRYYLAVARAGRVANSLTGILWDPAGSNTTERRADGPGRQSPLAIWNGSTPASGAYTISLTGTAFAPNQVLLPGNHHLSETANQTSGSTEFFRSAPTGHFQVIYEGTNFTAAGVNGSRTLTRLQMRGEDSVQNRGGQIYQNLQIRLANTTLTANTLSSSFATNLSPLTTTVGPIATIVNKVIKRATGTCPNNYVVDIDLQAMGIPHNFDPNGTRPNLLVDIQWPNAGPGPNGTNTIAIQDATGGPLVVRGRALTAANNTAPTGLLVDPPVINFEFLGGGGDDVLFPARVESIGAACGGSPSAIYQLWPHTERFDLGSDVLIRGITLTPDQYPAPNYYNVTLGASPVDLTKLNPAPNTTIEDSFVTHALPMPFHFPGGSTSTIRVDDNGHIRLTPAPLVATWDPTLPKFLGVGGGGPIVAPFWHDFSCGRNTLTHANSGLHVRTDGNDVYATWHQVGCYNTAPTPGGQSVNTMQCLIKTGTGQLELRFGAMDELTGSSSGGSVNGIVGFSRGLIGTTPSVDPGSTDLSRELPRRTYPEGPRNNLKQLALSGALSQPPHMPGRMYSGQSIRWGATDIPPGTTIGLQLLDLQAQQPGVPLPGVTVPGCTLGLSPSLIVHEMFLMPGTSVTGTYPLVVPPGLDGASVCAQFASVRLNGPLTELFFSNTLKHTIGKQ